MISASSVSLEARIADLEDLAVQLGSALRHLVRFSPMWPTQTQLEFDNAIDAFFDRFPEQE